MLDDKCSLIKIHEDDITLYYDIDLIDNIDKERISLGIKQLSDDPIQNYIKTNPIKSKVTGKITEIFSLMVFTS